MIESSRSRAFMNKLGRDTVLSACRRLQQRFYARVAAYRHRFAELAKQWAAANIFYGLKLSIGSGLRRLVKLIPGRSLVGEIVALQLVVSLFIGVLAIVGLWWASTWAIEDNLKRWGDRWIIELEELGVPLFDAQSADNVLQVESYINSFPEISFVRYYAPDGAIIFSDYPASEVNTINTLSVEYLEGLGRQSVSEKTFALDPALNESSLIRISKPIWTQSFQYDGLLGIDLTDTDAVQAELVGFVELGLNFSTYQAQLSKNITLGSLLGIAVLILLTSASGIFFRRALMPLSDLQKPLNELAKGRTDFSVESSGHKEIVAITEALNTTVSSLNERDKKLWQLANHDSLTGLMNRHQFGEMLLKEIDLVKERGITSALLFVDLDQFKYVNDTLGHTAGDRLLKQASEYLRNGIRKEDQVSRFGGDEFTILLTDVTEKDVKAVCTSLLKDMRDYHFHESGHTFNVPCSIGVVMIKSGNLTPAELLAQADLACHEAKNRGRNRFQIYKASGAETRQMAADVGWSQKIKEALKEDLFVIHYQPIVDVRTGRPTHYEVLLRMRAANKKLVPPAAFLPAASRFGLMTEVDQWVIRNAMKSLAAFRASNKDLAFTLNIPGNIFEDADLYGCIKENLELNKLPAASVVLEITEQVAVRNILTAADQISAISKLGCRFAIDDFGAGYSSYTYLKSLPVDYIKIDGSFVKNLGADRVDQTIVNSISQIAKATKKKTIAEHVVNAETFALLHTLGVDYAQGYYVGRPAAKPSQRVLPVPIETAKRSRKKAS